ncbi:MAG: hypothetical protein M1820_006662 [Bogoriella megaspora]|nr:MAG: hypothetical protein M1820_006662 [Bogoriella megaspora]
MSVEPRISLLLDDRTTISRSRTDYSSLRYSRPLDNGSESTSTVTKERPAKIGVSLAEVLNTDKHPRTPTSDSSGFALPPAKRQRVEDTSPKRFHLPKPEVRKKDRRLRIPPLLQGLHQPPPDAGLFPPITAEGNHDSHTPGLRQDTEAEPPVDEPKTIESDPLNEIASSESKIQQTLEKTETDTSKPRKKNKWTKDETADLLKGVARFGIGNWKSVLSHEEYTFNGRSAVDLKDRFRTVCPDEYVKFQAARGKKSKAQNKLQVGSEVATEDEALAEKSDWEGRKVIQRPSRSHRVKPEDLAVLGIDSPFTKLKRRERRAFTDEEDTALLKGLELHGSQWAQIRDDPELSLSHRKPTDLRDRVRNRWPEKYKNAGLVLRPKDIPRPVQRVGKIPEAASSNDSPGPGSEKNPSTPEERNNAEAVKPTQVNVTPTRISRAQPPPPPLKLLNAPIPAPLSDEFSDLGAYDDMVPESPITLDRSIFDWVNQNISQPPLSGPSQQYPNSSSLMPPPSFSVSDISSGGFDSVHINPLVTLNKPLKNNPAFPSIITPPSLQSSGFAFMHSSTLNVVSSSLPSMNVNVQAAPNASKGTTSASSGAFNLPPPSEVLAGFIDGDNRVEVQGPVASFWDDLLN